MVTFHIMGTYRKVLEFYKREELLKRKTARSILFLKMRQKYIIHTNIDKIMKIKMIKNIQTSTNTR